MTEMVTQRRTLDRNITKIQNCENFEKIRTMLNNDSESFAIVLEAYSSETVQSVTAINSSNVPYGFVVKTLIDIVKLGAKFFQRKHEAKKKEIVNNLEFALIDALEKDFKNYGLLIVDTFEKYKTIDIKSKIDFDNETILDRSVLPNCPRVPLMGSIGLSRDGATGEGCER